MQEKLFYRLAEKEDAEQICEFMMKYFYPEEPITQAMGLKESQQRPIYVSLIERCLQFPFSTIVTLESGEFVAVTLKSVWRRDEVDSEGADYEIHEGSERLEKFVELLNQCHEDFWDLAPSDLNAVIHLEIASVAHPFQRRGIATKMLTENMTKEKIAEYSVGGMISETSSFANQVLMEKNGFKTLKEIPYSSVLDSQGNQIAKTTDGSDVLKLHLKLIKDFHLD